MHLDFKVEPWLLACAEQGDAAAQYQIGIQALSENQFGIAKMFFRLAHVNRHPFAGKYYKIAARAERNQQNDGIS